MSEREEWSTTRYRFRIQGSSDFVRVLLRSERGVVVRFTVQYEVIIDEHVYPALRYDSAHGDAHQDTLDWRGRVVDKQWIFDKPYDEIVTEAIAELKANWVAHREAFIRRRP